jgi:hypothetical protein
VQALEQWQDERRRLAGAGLGARENVAPGKDEWDRLRLDRRRFRIALMGDGAKELGRQPEMIE